MAELDLGDWVNRPPFSVTAAVRTWTRSGSMLGARAPATVAKWWENPGLA